MDSTEEAQESRRRLFRLGRRWAIAVLALYALHFATGIYHEASLGHYALCAAFGLPVLGLACACPVAIAWVWGTQRSRARKIRFTVRAIAITVLVVCPVGFVWLLLHMAP